MRRVELNVRIGEHDWEKNGPQRLLLDLALEVGFADYFERHGGYVDYDPLRTFLQSLQQRDHVNRIEELARVILAACFAMTPAARVTITMIKPDVFDEMDGVGLRFDVRREDFRA